MNEQAQIAALLLAGFISGGDPSGGDTLQAKAASPKPQIISISETGCRVMRRQIPAQDVAYRPDATVRSRVLVDGKPVAVVTSGVSGGPAAASLEPTFSHEMRPVYEFAVKIQPFPATSRFHAETGLEVATVAFDPETRRVTVDGKELVWLHEQALIDACGHTGKIKDH